jgi:uncharacterized protein (DUF2126 family)
MSEWIIQPYKTSPGGCWYFTATDGTHVLKSTPLSSHESNFTRWGARQQAKRCIRNFLRGEPAVHIPTARPVKYTPKG